MQQSRATGSTPITRTRVDTMMYEGLVRIGTGAQAVEVPVRIPDVEEPNWFGFVDESLDKAPKGEVVVALLDDGAYRDWSGSAIVALGGGQRVRLLGHEPLTPPASDHHAVVDDANMTSD